MVSHKFDVNEDGNLTAEDLEKSKEILELEIRQEKRDEHKKMAWLAMISMVSFTVLLFSPVLSDSRVQALSDLLGLFYIAQAGVVGAYMGFNPEQRK
jgi:hypothetical protein